MKPEQHHPDCDYRNSYAAKEAAEIMNVDIAEHEEVFDCNLGCEDMAKRAEDVLDNLSEADYEKVTREAEREYNVGATGLSEDDPRACLDLVDRILSGKGE